MAPQDITRRKFFKSSLISATGIMLGSRLIGCLPGKEPESIRGSLMEEVMKYRKIDAHDHVGLDPGDLDELMDFSDRLGIGKICISRPITNYSGKEPEDPAEVRKGNDIIAAAVKQYPEKLIGYFTLNPRYPKESLEEIQRCTDLGLSGYKGYTQVKINDPLYYPIIEKLTDLKMIVFMHAFCQLG
ncbi:MAG TPA: amidohydrolase family protein, partial [Cyclobacteriaceae bacterium]|nr:amidohydrolase family protein [Cyclobacteriaceae bacterium]